MIGYQIFRIRHDSDLDSVSKRITIWLQSHTGYEPYGTPIINPKGDGYDQIFVKYDNELNDKFLGLLLEELKYVPGTGSAFKAAEERFYGDKNVGGKNNKTRKYRKK